MQTSAFKAWLQTSYLQKTGQTLAAGTQISRIANCSTIEQVEGDLDEHFDRDGMESILHMLTYSAPDYEKGIKPKHHIPIRGNVWNGTTTHRSAANLYRKFRIAQTGDEERAIDVILASLKLSERTERTAVQKIRTTQKRFRYMVLEQWDYRCAVTNSGLMLTAAHIKPWSKSDDEERQNPFNGLCLSPLYDRAFDKGLITFANDGKLTASDKVPMKELKLVGISNTARLTGLVTRHKSFLDFHRKEVWLK
ncbi:MAG: HNH endonuclease [Flavobacteriales bacterium]